MADGVRQFNRGDFFAAHESFEAAWRATPYPERLCGLALTKLAAGFEHARRGNGVGARRLIVDGLRCLAPFEPRYAGLDTAALGRGVREWLGASSAGPLPRITR